jgi:glutathione S-transferase
MKLYGYRNGRTLRALWALEEVGAQYEYVEVDVIRGEGQSEWFLAINSAGKVPVLVDDDLTLSESAAICMHLADKHPSAPLLPPLGTKARSECYKWISFILTEIDAPLWTMAKHRFVLPADRRVSGAIDTAIWEFGRNIDLLAGALALRPYLCDSFSVRKPLRRSSSFRLTASMGPKR